MVNLPSLICLNCKSYKASKVRTSRNLWIYCFSCFHASDLTNGEFRRVVKLKAKKCPEIWYQDLVFERAPKVEKETPKPLEVKVILRKKV